MAAPERLVQRLRQFGDDEYRLLCQLADEIRHEIGWSKLGSVEMLLRALRNPLPEVVSVIVGRICYDGESPAYDQLADQLESWDPAGFWTLAEALFELTRLDEQVLVAIVQCGDEDAACEAIDHLVRLDTDEEEFLIRLLADPCRHIQERAAWAVASLHIVEVDPTLDKLIEGCDCGPHIQNPHMPFRSPRTRLTCESCREHPGWYQPVAWTAAVRASDILYAYLYSDEDEEPKPTPALRDDTADSVQIRRAYRDLVETAPNAEPIIEVLTHEDVAACFLVPLVRALARFDQSVLAAADNLVPCLFDALAWVSAGAAAEIVGVIGKTGDRTAVEWLIDLLAERNEAEVREATVRALGDLGDWEAAELLEWLANKEAEAEPVRQVAREALIRLAVLGPDTREPGHWSY